jgi:hypothetical protein
MISLNQMSKYQIAKAVQRELEILNRRIDQKILRGMSYVTEARRHKMLLAQLNRLHRHNSIGFLSRIASVFSFS